MTELSPAPAIGQPLATRNHRVRWAGLAVFVVLLHAALLFVGIPQMGRYTHGAYNQSRMADGYDQLAGNLAAGRGYRFYPDTAATTMREPGYPLILAAITLGFGPELLPVQVFNLIVALATAGLVGWFAWKYAWIPGTSLLVVVAAPTLFLLHPGVLVAESRGGVEILFGFLVVVFLLLVLRAMETQSWTGYVLSGLVLGVTVLVRSVPILFPAFLVVFLLCLRPRLTSRLRLVCNVFLMGVAMTAVLSPWIVRNYILLGRFVPSASVFGVSAQAGQYINQHLFEGRPFWLLDREAARQRDLIANHLGYAFEDGPEGYYQTFYRSQDELRFSKYLTGQVVSTYKREPQLFLRTLVQNFFGFWVSGKTWSATLANTLIQLPYLAVACAGFLSGLRRRPAAALLLLTFIVYVIAVHMPILAQARYSIPLLPLLSMLGAFVCLPGAVTLRPQGTRP